MRRLIGAFLRRPQACGRLLERLFPFGTRTFLRMTMVGAGKGYTNRLGAFVERAFNDTRRLLAERVGAAHWLNPVERAVAREKLAATRLDFVGAEADLKVPTAYYDSDGPHFDGARLLSSYVQMQAHTRRLYYHPIAVGRRVWDFDNRCGPSVHYARYSHLQLWCRVKERRRPVPDWYRGVERCHTASKNN